MSTRATYEIGDFMFYVHHDGYPAGAAGYFANMIEAMTVPAAEGVDAIEQRRGGAPFAFIRGNMNAEPTESHEAHGDTEYRWRIDHDGIRLTVQRQQRTNAPGYHWTAWSSAEPLAAFIDRHYPGLIVAIDSPDEHWKRELAATIENAIGIAAIHRRFAARYGEGNPNGPRHAKHAEAWERAIAEQLPARVRYLEKVKAEAAEELAKGRAFGRDYYERAIEGARRELETLRKPIGELAA